MSTAAGMGPRPESDEWVVTVSDGEHALQALGSGLLLDELRVLTCAHVACPDGVTHDDLWVRFPKSEQLMQHRIRVLRVTVPKGWPHDIAQDAAILELSEPVPRHVAARIRVPISKDLRGALWWAFGFPDGALGDSSDGIVGDSLAYGWVRLDTESRNGVRSGFSGAGLWSPAYEAVVGILGQANGATGDARGLTLRQIDLLLPEEKLALLAVWSVESAGEGALAAWGWALERDPEAQRHWRPRARGVSSEAEGGYRFRGRRSALTKIVEWIAGPTVQRKVMVVTGSPGVGKSAVLGRIVTSADQGVAGELPADDVAVRAQVGIVSCAVHAKGKTAMEVAEEIARGASAPIPEQILDLVPALRTLIETTSQHGFTLILDALDEAADPEQTRLIISRILLPLVETCGPLGARVVAGSRRRDDAGDLLGLFGGGAQIVNLDSPEYFEQSDLADYARATLQLQGDERPDNPYATDKLASTVADRIAEISNGNFLVAGLVARAHGMHDQVAIDPAELSFATTVAAALDEYVARLPSVSVSAVHALTALAFAESPGLEVRLWRGAIQALYDIAPTELQLRSFARSSAANFLVESSKASNPSGEFRLFHQALNDALLEARADISPSADDEKAIARALLADARSQGWPAAPAYTLRSLARHATRGGVIDEVLADETFPLYADLRRLIAAAGAATTPQGQQRARVLRRTTRAMDAPPAARAAMFNMTEACSGLDTTPLPPGIHSPYQMVWTNIAPSLEEVVLAGHTHELMAVCTVRTDERELLASGDFSGAIQLWDPSTGEHIRTLDEDWDDAIYAMCTVRVNGRELLAAGDDDGAVQLWDPSTGKVSVHLGGYAIRAMCSLQVDGHDLLAVGDDAGTVLLWDPSTGQQVCKVKHETDWVRSMCEVKADEHGLLAVGDSTGTVRLLDPSTGQQVRPLIGHTGAIYAMCTIQVGGHELLASSSNDGTVRLWNPVTGRQVHKLTGHTGEIASICALRHNERELLVFGGSEGTMWLWDPHTGQHLPELAGHTEEISSVCAVHLDGHELLATVSADRTVRLWDPLAGQKAHQTGDNAHAIHSVCMVHAGEQSVLASGDDFGAVQLWNPSTGRHIRTFRADFLPILAVCAVRVGPHELLASGDGAGTVRVWDPYTGERVLELQDEIAEAMDPEDDAWVVPAMCMVQAGTSELLARANAGAGVVELWDLDTRQLVRELPDGLFDVNELFAVRVDERELLAVCSGANSWLQIWNPDSGRLEYELDGGGPAVRAFCVVHADDRILLAAGDEYGVSRLWALDTWQQISELTGHYGSVNKLCPLRIDGRALLACGGDNTVIIWDLDGPSMLLEIPTPAPVLALAENDGHLILGLATGLIAVKITLAD